MRMETDRTAGMDSVTICNPFESVCFLMFDFIVFTFNSALLLDGQRRRRFSLTSIEPQAAKKRDFRKSLYHLFSLMQAQSNRLLNNVRKTEVIFYLPETATIAYTDKTSLQKTGYGNPRLVADRSKGL